MLNEFIEEEQFVEKNSLAEVIEDYVDNQITSELNYDDNDLPLIEDKNQAEYFTKLYKQAQKNIEDNKAAYKQYLENQTQKADQWLEKVNKTPEYMIEQIGILLEDYVRKNLNPDDKKKSIQLINGTLGLRAQPPEFIYEDDVIREFLEKNRKDLLIVQPSKIDKKALKKIGQIDGENLILDGKNIPGIKIESREDSFYVK